MSNTYKSIKIKKEDYYTLKKLKDQFNCEFYEVVSKLISTINWRFFSITWAVSR